MNKLDYILGILDGVAQVVAVTGGAAGPVGIAASGGAAVADYLLKIARASVQAHEAVTGKALDMTTLHHIDPVQ